VEPIGVEIPGGDGPGTKARREASLHGKVAVAETQEHGDVA
jgi:hypothetical protein